MEAATRRPELVFRNPEKVKQGWQQMREDRAGFVEFFGGDELVLPPAEAAERLNAYYRHRQEAALARQPAQRRPRTSPAWTCPPSSSHPDTVDAVFRKILRRRDFTWAEHGEPLMRRRKAWYYQHEPDPASR
jgi:hypothetical protein